MTYEFKFPDVGEGVHEGTLVKWLVKEGDAIHEDQVLAEVETDKAVVEVPSPKSGTIAKLKFKEGDVIKVGEVMLTIDENGALKKEGYEKKEAPMVGKKAPAPAEEPRRSVSPAALSGRVLAAPATRKLARDLGIDITKVRGSGPAGRVTPEDVNAAAGGKPAAPSEEQTARVSVDEGGVVAAQAPRGPAPAHAARVTFEKYGRVIRVAYKGVRKIIGDNMVRSKIMIPHVVHMDWADVTELWAIRQAKKEFAENKGVSLTLLPFIVKAVCHALVKHPYLNASLDEEKGEIVLKKHYHIGFAVDTGKALLVPNVKNANDLSILEIAKEMQKLSEQARDGDIKLEDMKGGTFTITNIGSIGGEHFTPVIYHPECAILGVGRAKDMPVVKDGGVVVRKMLPVSLAFDHRITDGAEAARFVNDIIAHLQDPDLLLLDAV